MVIRRGFDSGGRSPIRWVRRKAHGRWWESHQLVREVTYSCWMRVGCLSSSGVVLANVEGKAAAYLVSYLQSAASGCRDRLRHLRGVVVVLVILVTADVVQGLQ
jgi:F420-0:gamma-glutamyl ligase-like protein